MASSNVTWGALPRATTAPPFAVVSGHEGSVVWPAAPGLRPRRYGPSGPSGVARLEHGHGGLLSAPKQVHVSGQHQAGKKDHIRDESQSTGQGRPSPASFSPLSLVRARRGAHASYPPSRTTAASSTAPTSGSSATAARRVSTGSPPAPRWPTATRPNPPGGSSVASPARPPGRCTTARCRGARTTSCPGAPTARASSRRAWWDTPGRTPARAGSPSTAACTPRAAGTSPRATRTARGGLGRGCSGTAGGRGGGRAGARLRRRTRTSGRPWAAPGTPAPARASQALQP